MWKIKSKGYKVFIQAMVSLSYTDEEFLRLINYANKIGPYAFYIVDSFGMMKRKVWQDYLYGRTQLKWEYLDWFSFT